MQLQHRANFLDVWGIARMLAGDPNRWDLVYWQNFTLFDGSPFNLKPGTTLNIVIPHRRTVTVVLPKFKTPDTEITLRPDLPAESIERVAERTLGHSALAHYLREAAGNVIPESGVLEVGQEIHVPALVNPNYARQYWRRLRRGYGVRMSFDSS